ncbi:hypothetical protein EVG20_g8444 [Dentipellis fragilis]|uniref:SnoaL-like domain-containing protein n=1 Tax=Dentipellis fragilis TaxID=205917 RepID=A0A4Y9Y7D5_9AGAM|nr:hypothetical protein EVG20_g8444 [Dentipellis fragilis]
MTTPSRTELIDAFNSFVGALASGGDMANIVAHFSKSQSPEVIEYGLTVLAPFLGRPYVGADGVAEYFNTIGTILTWKDMGYYEHVVDPVVRKVSAKGKATWTWKSTGQSWQETFTTTVDFDDELKVKRYQVWADSGAAYLASRGELRNAEVS